jgi:YVTN family beta-propeller protein
MGRRLVVALGFTFLLFFSVAGGAFAFNDVGPDHPYLDAITTLSDRGAISGFDDGTFRPDSLVTRQQFAKIIVKTLGLAVTGTEVCPFIDVTKGTSSTDPFYPDKYVAVCAAQGIAAGKSPSTFVPGNPISRYQLITMVVRAMDTLYPGALETPPADYQSTWDPALSSVHGDNARRAEFNHLLAGLRLSHIDPNDPMPRGEVAQVLARVSSQFVAPLPYYPMDNVHALAVRPGGKELYAYSWDPSVLLVVDLAAPGYPVIGDIPLTGRRGIPGSSLSFSADGTRAFLCRVLDPGYEYGALTDTPSPNYVAVIDAVKRQVEFTVDMPPGLVVAQAPVPSPDGKWLYVAANTFDGKQNHLGVAKIDLGQRKMVDFLVVEGANFLAGSADGKRLYVARGLDLADGSPAPNLLSVVDTGTFAVTASVPVGKGPRYVAVTPDGRKAYVFSQLSNDTTVIDLETATVVTTLDIGADRSTIAIAPDGRKAYITLPGSGFTFQFGYGVAVIDVRTDTFMGAVPVHIEPITIAMDPDGTKTYVSDGNANGRNPAHVHVIDTVSDRYLRPIILRPAATIMPTAIDVSHDGQTLFVLSEGKVNEDKRVLVVDIASRTVLHWLPFKAPRALKVSADGTKVYVLCEQELDVVDSATFQTIRSVNLSGVYPDLGDGGMDQEVFSFIFNRTESLAYLSAVSEQVVVVNMTTGQVVGRIPFAEQPMHVARGLALSPDGAKLFVSDYHSNTVSVIDTISKTVIKKIPVVDQPTAIRVSADGKRVYVLGRLGMAAVSVFDAQTYGLIRTYAWSVSQAIDFELPADERYIYFADWDPNWFIAYDLQEDKAVKIVKTGLDPFNMVSSPDKRYIYITNFTSDSVSIFDTQANDMIGSITLR